MIWVIWRQHRLEALIGGIALALGCVLLVVTGVQLANNYQSTGLAACVAQHLTCTGSREAFNEFFNQGIAPLVIWLYALPLLVGMFVGAPLVAGELERGTHRLVWTQSVTRLRWLAVKLGVLVGATALVFAGLSALMAWWSGPVNAALGPWNIYDWQGVAPIAYALFALALGIAAGTLAGRSVAAIAATLAVFAGLRLVIEFVLRPSFLPPLSYSWALGVTDPRAYVGDLDISNGLVAPSGQSLPTLTQLCGGQPAGTSPKAPGSGDVFFHCLSAHGVLNYGMYQPADRFWLFQGIESAIFVALAAALLALTVWWMRRRLA
jgi:hypothetical protein